MCYKYNPFDRQAAFPAHKGAAQGCGGEGGEELKLTYNSKNCSDVNYWYFEIRRRATRAMILNNLMQETKFLGRRWQRRRVYTDLPSQGWVPIERGGKRRKKTNLLKIYVIFVDLTEDYCPGIYLDHNNMEPPQWPGTCYNLVKQRSHDSTNNLMVPHCRDS